MTRRHPAIRMLASLILLIVEAWTFTITLTVFSS